ncbi:MAG: putative peptidoglycan lipid II flippase MurJ [Candidatus Uhrbacteria bacterium GW2011_GWF2_39_13]|uniref:Probable lipid II flippase MurJ n=1 Tax=Candidatus Uhrbacteria bacterium GW2011_GWF2_39_13 TaxID=1618995 RepID=A0A0G0MWS8_9BACT|nr:MAG: putative peptidoglycan lipid II flippase MurJ [Candidatus Uhrbacteria bacterium GW2011_GWF2_39_13]HAU66106.1 murein biosynthesis integral membrane protein MurJ [Candidatus Uhrbacteria bacterium]
MFNFFERESKTIIGAAAIVGILSLTSRLVGFIRDRILAGTFGAGDTLDVYYAAFKIPDFLFNLIVVGALSASFIPIFLSHYHKPLNRHRAWDFTNNAVHLIGGTILVFSLIFIFFATPLAHVIAPGFEEFKQVKVTLFMRIMFLGQIFLAISLIYGSVLQSLKHFFVYSLAPLFYNAGILIGALWLEPLFGSVGLAWGVVLGAFLHLCTQVIGMRGTGYRYRFLFNIRSKDICEMGRLMGPRTIGLAVNQLMFMILTIIASTFVAGSLTVFQFAYNIQFFAVGIFGVSFAIAVFPTLSEFIEKKELSKFIETVSNTTSQLCYLLIPMTLLFLIFRAQIVRVVVGAGAFDWSATILTADTLAFFALTFIPQSLVYLLARAFYALHDTITPLTIAFVSAFVGILSAFLFRQSFGVISLAIAYSISSIINALLLWISLRQRVGTLQESIIFSSLLKMVTCGLFAAVVMQFLKPIVVSFIPLETFIGVFLQAFIAGGAGLLVYVILGMFLGVQEQKRLIDALKRHALRHVKLAEVAPDN